MEGRGRGDKGEARGRKRGRERDAEVKQRTIGT